jgi:hypothetical protein
MASTNIEITLEKLRTDYDWAQVFADESDGNVDKVIEIAPPGANVSDEPFGRDDVQKIIAAVEGENDEADWLGLFLLKDGRYAVCSGGCDYTGWDCRGGNSMIVCESFEDAIQFGLSSQERERLGIDEVEDDEQDDSLSTGNCAFKDLLDAARVVLLDKKIGNFIKENDPKAFKQLVFAVADHDKSLEVVRLAAKEYNLGA